ncbi:hypothetical protein ABIA33_006442 [Streptacidiphilus sp. MAP12-16]|uniref:hypothetical protein n=1 Tax=Streptacidiphilus sp. MAP12-16 TaxID=3156300 RepID=UPI0035132888
MRAEFTVHGNPARYLREVPLEPDPLQPVVDAVADLRADLGDLAEIVLDLQPVPRWRLRLRRGQILADARTRSRAEARRESRLGWSNAADVEDSWRYQLSQLLEPSSTGGSPARRLQLSARPRPVNRAATLGRIGKDTALVRIQLLVRCCSNAEGRAERRLQQLAAALDIFAEDNRLRMDGRRLGPWHWGANHRLRRGSFDRRWSSGLVVPRGESWVRIDELAGFLKPVTVHCRLPLLATQVPTYELGSQELLPHGWYTAADGRTRLIASPLHESLFSLSVGKSTYGKTEKAVVQALALAHGGHGVTFIDPHADSWALAAPYLAHDSIRDRVWHLDLTGRPDTAVASWNPLGLEHGQVPAEVVRAVVDGFASVLGWSDLNAPRALTVLTKCAEALVAVNTRAVATGYPQCQATLFQIRPLLSDPAWRAALLARLEQLDPQAWRWWNTSFPALAADALPVVTNPIDRLAADPTALAFLGSPARARPRCGTASRTCRRWPRNPASRAWYAKSPSVRPSWRTSRHTVPRRPCGPRSPPAPAPAAGSTCRCGGRRPEGRRILSRTASATPPGTPHSEQRPTRQPSAPSHRCHTARLHLTSRHLHPSARPARYAGGRTTHASRAAPPHRTPPSARERQTPSRLPPPVAATAGRRARLRHQRAGGNQVNDLDSGDGVAFYGTVHDYWSHTQVRDWVMLHPQMTRTAYLLYCLLRSMVAEKQPGSLRRMSLDQLCWLLPGINGKPTGVSTITDALRLLAGLGLVTNPDGQRTVTSTGRGGIQNTFRRYEVHDLPPQAHRGWRNAWDKLDAYRPDWRQNPPEPPAVRSAHNGLDGRNSGTRRDQARNDEPAGGFDSRISGPARRNSGGTDRKSGGSTRLTSANAAPKEVSQRSSSLPVPR